MRASDLLISIPSLPVIPTLSVAKGRDLMQWVA
jgi:hypothetical protein